MTILQVQSALQLCEELRSQHAHVASKSRALHVSCEKLVAEKDRLVDLADAIKQKLAYFDELEKLAAKFHSANLSIESEDFLGVLKRLDECLTYRSPLISGLLLVPLSRKCCHDVHSTLVTAMYLFHFGFESKTY